MIRITVELVSAIDPSRDRILGLATIANVGSESGSPTGIRYTYDVKLSKWAPKEGQTWKRGQVGFTDTLGRDVLNGEVRGFDRNARGAWDLLYLALKAVVGDRNP